MMEHDELKRRLRRLKRLEMELRFGRAAAQLNPRPHLVWDEYFAISGAKGRARYTLDDLSRMEPGGVRAVIEEYMGEVYFRAYGWGGRARDDESPAVLGLPINADREMVRKRYRELAKKYHPDAGGSDEDFIRIKQQFDALLGKL